MKKMILSATLLVAAFSFATAQNVKNADKKENKIEQCAKDKKQCAEKKDCCKEKKACCDQKKADQKPCCKKDAAKKQCDKQQQCGGKAAVKKCDNKHQCNK